MRYGKPRGDRRNDEPGKKAAHYPEAFPCPAFNLFIWDVKTAGRKATNKVEDDAKYYLHDRWKRLVYNNTMIKGKRDQLPLTGHRNLKNKDNEFTGNYEVYRLYLFHKRYNPDLWLNVDRENDLN